MKKNRTSQADNNKKMHSIPDLEIIDLETENSLRPDYSSDENSSGEDYDDGEYGRENSAPKKAGFLSRINMHIVLLAVALLFVFCIVYKFLNWGEYIDLEEIFADGPGTYDDTFDEILPLVNADGEPVYLDPKDDISILVFGNAPFADDRNSKEGLANIIQSMTGATVYNCSVSGSYLAAISPVLDAVTYPVDIFNFYWLCTLATTDVIDNKYQEGLERLGADAPPEAREVYDTIKALDMSTIDVIVVMYDGSDYLANHPMYSDTNSTEITQFTGNLEAGIELLQDRCPNSRIIVLSPTYAYGLDENGNYVSSDIQRYDWDVLSTYVIKQYASCASRSVTFVDNLYGTITEDNADDYLIDHLHLNVEGRKKVAERFVHALYYFKEPD